MLIRLTLASLFITLLTMTAAAQQTPTPPQRTITVTGTAEKMVPPDLGIVVLAIQTQANTVARAAEQNNAAATKVMNAIRALNIANLTMRTTGFDVTPMYAQPAPGQPMPNPPKITGYQIVNRLEVRVPETDSARLSNNVGRVLDAALDAGANRVDEVNFSLQNDQAVMREVLANATRNAAQTAQTLATAAAVTLGPLMTLSANPSYIPPPMPYYARAEAAQAAVPIAAGQLTIRATVNAVYEIR